jgi:hypothetical protein
MIAGSLLAKAIGSGGHSAMRRIEEFALGSPGRRRRAIREPPRLVRMPSTYNPHERHLDASTSTQPRSDIGWGFTGGGLARRCVHSNGGRTSAARLHPGSSRHVFHGNLRPERCGNRGPRPLLPTSVRRELRRAAARHREHRRSDRSGPCGLGRPRGITQRCRCLRWPGSGCGRGKCEDRPGQGCLPRHRREPSQRGRGRSPSRLAGVHPRRHQSRGRERRRAVGRYRRPAPGPGLRHRQRPRRHDQRHRSGVRIGICQRRHRYL